MPDESVVTPPADALPPLRAEIEQVDRQLVALLAQRMQLARRVGAVKRAAQVAIVDPAREAAVVRRAGAFARALGLPEDEVRQIFWQVIALARRIQADEA
jgi:chorismate mutase